MILLFLILSITIGFENTFLVFMILAILSSSQLEKQFWTTGIIGAASVFFYLGIISFDGILHLE